jgi:N-methylhydantoinase A/oxoprolinase/acetone carboxylase beta subunit
MTGPIRVGLDVGGTKTDAVASDDDGRVSTAHDIPTERATHG